jgi:uncharacterized protein (UPF0254 family)
MEFRTKPLKVASAECFTHGDIGKTLHLLSAPYAKKPLPLKVVYSSFVPSPEVFKKLFQAELPPPQLLLNGYIKLYTEEDDCRAATLMAKALKEMLGVDVAIASSAGVGRGCVAVLFGKRLYLLTSDVYADLITSTPREILKRKTSAVRKTIKLLKDLIED